MNTKVRTLIGACTLTTTLAFSPNLIADEGYSIEGKQYILGLKSSFGAINVDRNGDDGDLQVSLNPYYHYQYDKTWALTFDYINGKSDDTFAIFDDIIIDDHFEYQAFAIGAKAHHQLSNRWNLYGQLALHQFKTEQHIEFFQPNNQNGTGLYGAVGIEFRAYNGFGLGFEYHILDMDELSVNAVGLSASYMF